MQLKLGSSTSNPLILNAYGSSADFPLASSAFGFRPFWCGGFMACRISISDCIGRAFHTNQALVQPKDPVAEAPYLR